ncbi:MAG: hypothetical protein RL094_684 [Candidatus Parcubacteria bacterium]|jgi:hypothetical protein
MSNPINQPQHNDAEFEIELQAYFVSLDGEETQPSPKSLSDMLSRIPFPAEHPISTPYMTLPKRAWKATVPVAVAALVLGATLYGYTSRLSPAVVAAMKDVDDLSVAVASSEEFSDSTLSEATSEDEYIASAYSQTINEYSINENDF